MCIPKYLLYEHILCCGGLLSCDCTFAQLYYKHDVRLLIKNLGVSKNLRKRLVRITGTKYLPPNNEFIIKEALEEMCTLINKTKNSFEKAFLSILLISYIQPFEDGNKRAARLVGNAILQANDCCPLSYRSVTVTDYKKAILLFYEVNNLVAFKKIFIDQYLFAVENYF